MKSSFRKPPQPATAEDFVGGGSVQTLPDTVAGSHPWTNLVGTKRSEIFNVRLTEAEAAKLAFIAENTPLSRQAFVLKVLLPAIDEKIAKLTGKK